MVPGVVGEDTLTRVQRRLRDRLQSSDPSGDSFLQATSAVYQEALRVVESRTGPHAAAAATTSNSMTFGKACVPDIDLELPSDHLFSEAQTRLPTLYGPAEPVPLSEPSRAEAPQGDRQLAACQPRDCAFSLELETEEYANRLIESTRSVMSTTELGMQNLQKQLDSALQQLEDVRRHEQDLLAERIGAIEEECRADIEDMRRQLDVRIQQRQKEKDIKMRMQREKCELAVQQQADKLLCILGAQAADDLRGELVCQSIENNFTSKITRIDEAEHRALHTRHLVMNPSIRAEVADRLLSQPLPTHQSIADLTRIRTARRLRHSNLRVGDLLE
eukprot:scaffold1056_cov564-Prasinococcus_capsulatus_cf.AAC.21